jgi:tyrosyl-tRNA synthetase
VKAPEVISELRKQDLEILTEERLTKVIEGEEKRTAYIGFEPSSSLHIGNLAATIPLFTLARHSFKPIVLLANLHAFANDKGSMQEIQSFADADKTMLEKIASKIGLQGKIEYKVGTQFEDQAYFIQMLKLSRSINLTDAEKSMDEISKNTVSRMTSSIIYPLMQVLDIGVLGVSVAIGSIDQRKVHALAIDNLRKLGYATPVAIHNKIIMHGIDGKEKMSKSRANTIDLDESRESLEKKIRKTFCAPGNLEANPILGWYKALIFPLAKESLTFGQFTASSFPELEALWAGNKISPQELKAAVLRDLSQILI